MHMISELLLTCAEDRGPRTFYPITLLELSDAASLILSFANSPKVSTRAEELLMLCKRDVALMGLACNDCAAVGAAQDSSAGETSIGPNGAIRTSYGPESLGVYRIKIANYLSLVHDVALRACTIANARREGLGVPFEPNWQ